MTSPELTRTLLNCNQNCNRIWPQTISTRAWPIKACITASCGEAVAGLRYVAKTYSSGVVTMGHGTLSRVIRQDIGATLLR
jgi:hypothetical protein